MQIKNRALWYFTVTEHTDRAGVGFLSGISFAIQLQSGNHALIPVVHKGSPSKKDRRALSNNDVMVERKKCQGGLTAAQRLT
jgi:hypothetical protein